MSKTEQWMKSGRYLPRFMRDFHDAKRVFKTIHTRIHVTGNAYAKDVSWVAGQCYVIDIFLWYMAKRGYTLQKTRFKGEFADIEKEMHEDDEACLNSLKHIIKP